MNRYTQRRPLILKVNGAYNQLKEHGVLRTFRAKPKKRGPVWVVRGYPGKGYTKEFDAYITDKTAVVATAKGLRPYADKSGFQEMCGDPAQHWEKVIATLHDTDTAMFGHVLKVVRPQPPTEGRHTDGQTAYLAAEGVTG